MPDRYYSESLILGDSVTLGGTEAHHLLHVMRATVGTRVVVFDGHGGEWSGEVAKLGRTEVEITLGEHHPTEREPTRKITLAVVLPKGDRQRWLVEKCVELGVPRLVPLTTEHGTKSASEPPAKLARYVVEASKQCGRNRLMEIAAPVTWSEFVASTEVPSRLVAHPGGTPLSKCDFENTAALVLAVGPEGGFSVAEIQLAERSGWRVVGLGERILRIETAALAVVAKLSSNT